MPPQTVNSAVNHLVSVTTSKKKENTHPKKIVIISTFHGLVHGVNRTFPSCFPFLLSFLFWEKLTFVCRRIASRTLIVRELKGLQEIVPITVVHYHMGDRGWRFVESDTELEGSSPDPLYDSKFLRELYFRAEPE